MTRFECNVSLSISKNGSTYPSGTHIANGTYPLPLDCILISFTLVECGAACDDKRFL